MASDLFEFVFVKGISTGGKRRGPSMRGVSGSWPVKARRRESAFWGSMEKIGGVFGGCFSMTLLRWSQRWAAGLAWLELQGWFGLLEVRSWFVLLEAFLEALDREALDLNLDHGKGKKTYNLPAQHKAP